MWRPITRLPTHPRWSEHQSYLVDQTIALFERSHGVGFTKDTIIRSVGCESVEQDPLSIEFHNTIIRCNEVLRPHGFALVKDSEAQIWRLGEIKH